MSTNIENSFNTPVPQPQEVEPMVQQPDALQAAIAAEKARLMEPGAVITHAHSSGEVKTMEVASLVEPTASKPLPQCLKSLSQDMIMELAAISNVMKTFDVESYKKDLAAKKTEAVALKEANVTKEHNEKPLAAVDIVEKPAPEAVAAKVVQLQRQAFEQQVVVTPNKQLQSLDKMTIFAVQKPESAPKLTIKEPVLKVAAVLPSMEQAPVIKTLTGPDILVEPEAQRPVKQKAEKPAIVAVELIAEVFTDSSAVPLEPASEVQFEPLVVEEYITVINTNAVELPTEVDVEALSEVPSEAVATPQETTVADLAEVQPILVNDIEVFEVVDTSENIAEAVLLVTTFLIPSLPNQTSAESYELVAQTSEVVSTYLQELEPEKLVEIEAQIEQLIVVADRLNFLVETSEGDSEEALLIDIFLARKFTELLTEIEPMLEALQITINDDTIAAFVAYVRSDKYQSKADLLADFIEIQNEGTHEKKLFDEAGVFAKAQQASKLWQQNLQSMLGRITVNGS